MKGYLLVFISVIVFCLFISKEILEIEYTEEELPEMTENTTGKIAG